MSFLSICILVYFPFVLYLFFNSSYALLNFNHDFTATNALCRVTRVVEHKNQPFCKRMQTLQSVSNLNCTNSPIVQSLTERSCGSDISEKLDTFQECFVDCKYGEFFLKDPDSTFAVGIDMILMGHILGPMIFFVIALMARICENETSLSSRHPRYWSLAVFGGIIIFAAGTTCGNCAATMNPDSTCGWTFVLYVFICVVLLLPFMHWVFSHCDTNPDGFLDETDQQINNQQVFTISLRLLLGLGLLPAAGSAQEVFGNEQCFQMEWCKYQSVMVLPLYFLVVLSHEMYHSWSCFCSKRRKMKRRPEQFSSKAFTKRTSLTTTPYSENDDYVFLPPPPNQVKANETSRTPSSNQLSHQQWRSRSRFLSLFYYKGQTTL